MSVILASSRGEGLQGYLPAGTTVTFIPGAKLADLTDKAKAIIPPPSSRIIKRTHVYFLCGVPDLSKLEKSYNPKYRECIFDKDPSALADQYKNQLRSTQQEILRHGALPIFPTIPKFSLEIYNNHQLEKNNTSYLKHQENYKQMQSDLDSVIDSVNSYIHILNKSINVSTPFLHNTIRQRRGSHPNRYYIQQYEKFRDGLHASDSLCIRWAEVLSIAIQKNSGLEDSDDEGSPKRSWRSSKRQRVE